MTTTATAPIGREHRQEAVAADVLSKATTPVSRVHSRDSGDDARNLGMAPLDSSRA